jgi:hypothetical protein
MDRTPMLFVRLGPWLEDDDRDLPRRGYGYRPEMGEAGKRAVDWFLEAAREPGMRIVRNNGKPIKVDGAILVWGADTALGRAAAIADYGFADILGLEDMLADMNAWQDPAWTAHVDELASHAAGLFEALK